MRVYRTDVSERSVGALRERSVTLPADVDAWKSLLVYGRDNYFSDRLVASIRIDAAPSGLVRIRVRALDLGAAAVDRRDAAEYGTAGYFAAPRLLAALQEHVEHASPGAWSEDWHVQSTLAAVTAERRFTRQS